MKFGDMKKVSSIKLIPRNMDLFSFKCFLFFMCLSSCFHESLTDKPKETLLTVLNKCTFSTDSGNSPSPNPDLNGLYEKWKFHTSSTDDVFPEIMFHVRSFQPQCSEEEKSLEVTFTRDKGLLGKGLFRNLTTNGQLIWEDSDGYLHSTMPHSFCVNINPNKTGETLSFMTCKSGCTAKRPCVRKCCPPNSIVDMESGNCNLTTKIWEPFFYSAVNHKAVDPKSYSVKYGFPSCTSKYIALANSRGNKRLNLLLNGSLAQVNGDSSVSLVNSNEFCIDGFPYHTVDGKQNENHVVNYSGSEWDQVAIICMPEPTVLNQCTDSYGEENIYSSEFSTRNSNYYFGNWFQNNMKDISEESKFNFFSLKPFQPKCAEGDSIIRVSLIPEDESPIDYKNGSLQNLTAAGELIWKDSNGYFHSSKPHAYCVNINPKNKTSREVSFMTCKSGCTVHRPCVRKCCPPNRILDVDSKTCNLTRKIWEPFFYSAVNHKVHKTNEPESYSINYGFPSCARQYIVEAKSKGDMRLNLLLNGSLVQINKDASVSILNSDEFCMDAFPYYTTDGKPNENNLANYSGSEWDQIAIICTPIQLNFSQNQTETFSLLRNLQDVKNIVTAVLITISAVCLLLMDIVYLILWKYKNIHEWLQFSCATSFLVAFTALAIAQTFSIQINNANPHVCKILGIVIYFSFLCAFFWMTSINADLWFRFNGCRPLRTRSKPTEDRKKFFFFALFSLGIPFLIAGSAVALDNIYMDNPNDAPIALPGFGQSYCYFKGRMVELPYAKGPQAVLFVLNIIFFMSTALYLRQYQKDTELARTNSNSDDKKGNFRLLAKLFIVMGILWIFELISWSAAVLYPDNEIVTLLIFFPADVLNALQGVAIFIIYVCKPNTINQLKATLIRKPSIKSIKTIQGTV